VGRRERRGTSLLSKWLRNLLKLERHEEHLGEEGTVQDKETRKKKMARNLHIVGSYVEKGSFVYTPKTEDAAKEEGCLKGRKQADIESRGYGTATTTDKSAEGK